MSDINAPVDPKSTLGYRAAKAAVIVLSVLIVLAVAALIVGGILRFSGRSTHVLGGSGSGDKFALPPGAKIVKTETESGRLILHVSSPQGDEIDIVSTDDGHLITQIKAPPPEPPTR